MFSLQGILFSLQTSLFYPVECINSLFDFIGFDLMNVLKNKKVFKSYLILQMNQNGTLLICDMTEMGMPSLNFECNQKNE